MGRRTAFGRSSALAARGERRDPMVAARETMRPEQPKRFYKNVGLTPIEDAQGHTLHALTLDGRMARTPARNRLAVQNRALAEALAAEWAAQAEIIDAATMPLTRLVNVALDRVPLAMDETRAEIASYAGNDLLFYRADAPEMLVARQIALWDPPLVWAARRFGAPFRTSVGILHVPQETAALAAIADSLAAIGDPLQLAALHVVTTLTGSALLALASAEGALSADAAWEAAHVDEDVQAEIWGADMEAAARRAYRRKEYDAAALVLTHCRN